MEVYAHLSMMLEISKGSLSGYFVRIEVGLKVDTSDYALDNKLG